MNMTKVTMSKAQAAALSASEDLEKVSPPPKPINSCPQWLGHSPMWDQGSLERVAQAIKPSAALTHSISPIPIAEEDLVYLVGDCYVKGLNLPVTVEAEVVE